MSCERETPTDQPKEIPMNAETTTMTATDYLEAIARTLHLENAEQIVPTLEKIADDEHTHVAIATDHAAFTLAYLHEGNRFMGEARTANFELAAAEACELAKWL
jgi:hypothetical protein